jgi:pimeloyl-ACP methyl ester carboxylesterase
MPSRHRIPVTDDESVVAVHHDAPSAEPAPGWIVFCHGFQSDMTGSYEGRCGRAVAKGYHGVRFDFRGCGESDGRFVDQTLSAKLADLRAVVAHFDPGRLVLFGSSFGGKVALHAAPDLDPAAAFVRAPVTYNRTFDERRAQVERDGEVALDTGKRIRRQFFADLDRYPFGAVVGELDCPVAIVHGADDASVDVGDSFEAAAALETDVLLEKVAGEGHRFSRDAEARVRTRLFDFLTSVDA